ncbi:MAG: hypothetical protein B7733_11300 [Myxococcales bacterium FL481]|nr:MAG: hypothetical protein B7733_11300 [Myxococcales bacterium FL481]
MEAVVEPSVGPCGAVDNRDDFDPTCVEIEAGPAFERTVDTVEAGLRGLMTTGEDVVIAVREVLDDPWRAGLKGAGDGIDVGQWHLVGYAQVGPVLPRSLAVELLKQIDCMCGGRNYITIACRE